MARARTGPIAVDSGRRIATGGGIVRVSPLRTVGLSKSGMRLVLEEDGSRLILRGWADPLLLYFAYGAALAVAVFGGLLVSPRYGLMGVALFSVLFSPLLLFLSVGAVRLRTRCVLDRAMQEVRVEERSYTRTLHHRWPLVSLSAVVVQAVPPSRWASGGLAYHLLLQMDGERYLAKVGANEGMLRRDARRIAHFVGVPLQMDRGAPSLAGGGRRAMRLLLLFAVPLVAASASLAVVLKRVTPPTNAMGAAMGALLVCQVGAILAYTYDRARSASGADVEA